MIKIKGTLRILALCLTLFAGTALAAESDFGGSVGQTPVGQNGGKALLNQTTSQGTINEGAGTGSQPSTENNNGNGTGDSTGTGNSNVLTTTVPENNKNNDSNFQDITDKNKLKESSNLEESKQSDNGIYFYVISIANVALSLIIAVLLLCIWQSNSRRDKRLTNVEKQLNDSVSSKSEGSAKLNELNDIKTRLFALENAVRELQQAVRNIEKFLSTGNRFERQPIESSQRIPPTRDIVDYDSGKKNVSALTALRQSQQTGSALPTKPTTETVRDLQGSSESQKIALAFNKMMFDLTRAQGLGPRNIRDAFMQNYRVVAFKCSNFEERINRPEVKPQFVTCQPSEGTLWGVPLSDGNLAVLPALREYESTAHSQGGLKELFDSDYRSGSYRKIEVTRPAIMTRDFQIIKKKGELRLG